MNLYNIFLTFNIVIMTVFSKNVDVKAGLEEPIPSSVGLKFVAEINNLNEHDCSVEVYPDECCLYNNDEKCDIVEIMGIASDIIGGGATKTFTMVAPLLDAYQRRGYCTFYIDSTTLSQAKTTMRDTVKIKFDTKLKKNTLPSNVKFCKHVDEDPLNDCNPVNCEIYYNGKKSHFSAKKRQCSKVPVCLSIKNSTSKMIYNPVSNKCDDNSALSRNDLDYIKKLTMGPTRRLPKEVLVLEVKPDFDPTTVPYGGNNEETEIGVSNKEIEERPTELRVTHIDLAKQQYLAKAKAKTKATLKANTNAKAQRKKKFEKILKYFRYNKYTVIALFCFSIVQCCLILTMVYCMMKRCICGKKKPVVNNFFNDKHNASVTTPLIATSNVDTETTEWQYMNESLNNIEKRIKCYRACQKDCINNDKQSMSDDIISKCVTRRNWLRSPMSKTIAEKQTDQHCNTNKVCSERKSISEVKPYNQNYLRDKIPNEKITVAKNNTNSKSKEKQFCDSSEIQICFHDYNKNDSKASADTVKNIFSSHIGGFSSKEKKKCNLMEKSAQASFSNDYIDDFLSDKGIVCIDDIASKCTYTTLSNSNKSIAAITSSKTSKNNIVKNFISSLPKKAKGPSSAPDESKSSTNLDLELLYISRVSLTSSLDTDGGKNIKRIKGSTG